MRTIDLNADVGEGAPHDGELIPLVTSANIACGGHAGDEHTMEAAARTAIEHSVAIGAHPGHEDPDHFGRRELPITPDELRTLLERQINRLHRVVVGLGGEVRYLKLHGALYHQAGRDPAVAESIIAFLEGFYLPLVLLGQPATALHSAAKARGIEFASEGFPDRGYGGDGSLLPRDAPGALLTDPDEVAAQGLALATRFDSLCLHGDSPGALASAQRLRSRLTAEGFALSSFAA